MMAWALFCHDFDLSKGINILSEKCPVVLDHYSAQAGNIPVDALDNWAERVFADIERRR